MSYFINVIVRPMKENNYFTLMIPLLPFTQTFIKKIPHTGDKESLDR